MKVVTLLLIAIIDGIFHKQCQWLAHRRRHLGLILKCTRYVLSPGGWFNKKIPSYQCRKSHCAILRPSYFHNGISYTGKMESFYWIRALQIAVPPTQLHPPNRPTRSNHQYKYQSIRTHTEVYRNSFYPRTIPDWNRLTAEAVNFPSADSFRQRLAKLPPSAWYSTFADYSPDPDPERGE